MNELFIIKRIDTQQYYHSILPRGRALWCDSEEDAQYLTVEEAGKIIIFLDNPHLVVKAECIDEPTTDYSNSEEHF